jgi:hypothetical protein
VSFLLGLIIGVVVTGVAGYLGLMWLFKDMWR